MTLEEIYEEFFSSFELERSEYMGDDASMQIMHFSTIEPEQYKPVQRKTRLTYAEIFDK